MPYWRYLQGVGRLKSLDVKRGKPRGKVNFAVGRLDKAGLARDLALGVLKDSGLERDSKPDTAASGPGLAWDLCVVSLVKNRFPRST